MLFCLFSQLSSLRQADVPLKRIVSSYCGYWSECRSEPRGMRIRGKRVGPIFTIPCVLQGLLGPVV